MGVWDSITQGLELGGQIGRQTRNAGAYREGGLDAVGEAAGRAGDLEGMETARTMQRRQRQFANQETEQAFSWYEKHAPYARNVLRAARNQQDPARRGQFLQSQRQRFEGMGFTPEQVDEAIQRLTNPETAEQAFTEYDAAFSEYENPDWKIDPTTNQIGGVAPNSGQWVDGGQAPQGFTTGEIDWQTDGDGRPYHIRNGQVVFGEGQVTPRTAYDFRPPAGYTGTPDALAPIPGGPADTTHRPVDRQTRDRVRGLRELESALSAYDTALQNYNPGIAEAVGAGGAAASIDSAAQILATQLNRSAFELGALAGPDYQIIVDAMGDPTNLQNLWRGGGGALRERLATVIQMVRNKRTEQERELRAQGIDPATVMGESNLAPPEAPSTQQAPQPGGAAPPQGQPRGRVWNPETRRAE